MESILIVLNLFDILLHSYKIYIIELKPVNQLQLEYQNNQIHRISSLGKIYHMGYSSVVEHATADREVHGSTPCAPKSSLFLGLNETLLKREMYFH